MKRWIGATCVAGLLFAGIASAQETIDLTDAATRKGGSLSLMAGGSFCLEGSESECENIDASFGLGVLAGYRFGPNIGLAADFFYGMYDLDGYGIDLASMGLTVGPKIYLPIGPADIVLGAGLGWSRISASATIEGYDVEIAGDGLGVMLMGGIEYRVSKHMSFGLQGRLNLAFVDQVCGSADGVEECFDSEDNTHNAMLGATMGFHF